MALAELYGRGKFTFDRVLGGETLRAKAMRGAAFLGGGSVAEQAIRFARNMLLTRLLAPSAFGAMAIVMAASAIVGTLTDVGSRSAVIQNPRGGETSYVNAGWWMEMGRAIGMYVVIFTMAPWVAHFYGNAELSGLLRVTLLGALFDGAMSPSSILLQKEMKFGRWMVLNNGGAICGVALTVILSFVLRDVWALAIGFCSENFFRCVLSYILCPGLPLLGWDRHAMRDLFRFSRAAFGLAFLNLVFSRTDVFVLGKLYSTTDLGLYVMAVALVQTPASFLTTILGQSLFPAIAHVQDDKERVNRVLTEVTSWLVLFGLPCVVVIYLCGHSLLSIFYGSRYVVGAGPLVVAAIVMFLTILNAAITCAFMGVGRPGLHRLAVAASAIVMLVLIYPACKLLGVMGGQVAALIAIGASCAIQILRMRELTGLNLSRYAKTFAMPLLLSGGLLAAGLGARFLGLATRPIDNVVLVAGACVIAYALYVPTFFRTRKTQSAVTGDRDSAVWNLN
jgi:O-antigen/teichoic acid export membrane protein